MIRYSREGLTIDVVARVLRRTVLSPWIVLPASSVLFCGVTSTPFNYVRLATYICALLGTTLMINEWLDKKLSNNWEGGDGPSWIWSKEIILVTGGSSGIGASICEQLLTRNPRTTLVIVDYVPLTWTAKTGTNVFYYQCDITDAGAIKELVVRVREDVGHPTVLVNNAGLCRGATVMDGSYNDVELTVRTNLIAPFLLVKEVLPHMIRMNHGHIVNVGSMSSVFPPAKVADYAATKAGITAFHEALQLELKHVHHAPRVRLTLGLLGFIKTPLFKGETRQSHFLFPLLHVDTVGETFVDALYSGLGGTIYLPGIMRYASMLRAGPEWVARVIREETQSLGVDFKGRQKVNEETGRLE